MLETVGLSAGNAWADSILYNKVADVTHSIRM